MYHYIIKELQQSSEKYGDCEVCHKKISGTMYYQVEKKEYKHGWTSHMCKDYFGHKECLEQKRFTPNEVEVRL